MSRLIDLSSGGRHPSRPRLSPRPPRGVKISGELVLASASPRREELLALMGLDFEVVPSSVDEAFMPGERPEDHVLRLAREKALSVAASRPEAWVLGADTIVVIDGEVLGKPETPRQAREMLTRLSGATHEVFTGFAVVRAKGGLIASRRVRSLVTFRDLTPDEIAWYTATEEPYDKAGAYAVQGAGAFFIREIRGSYTNVMGLPLCEVVDTLKALGALTFS
ncbi:MAG TPA: nucleoside triphosphate pyrophosphatase [Syntrophales bacterium]|nr:nucleoside triphosphate pyrophosphatase [Syntrophales bacterium]